MDGKEGSEEGKGKKGGSHRCVSLCRSEGEWVGGEFVCVQDRCVCVCVCSRARFGLCGIGLLCPFSVVSALRCVEGGRDGNKKGAVKHSKGPPAHR